MARVDLPQSRIRAQRRKRREVLIAVIFFIVLLICGGLVWLSHASFLRITAVQVSGEQTISESDIQAVVQNQIAGSYAHLFAKNNIFLYPKNAITSALIADMPVIASAAVRTVNFHTIEIVVVERQSAAVWCPDGDEATQGGNTATSTPADSDTAGCLLLDQNGTAYASAGFAMVDSSYKRYYGALSGKSLPEQYLTPQSFNALGALVDAIAKNQSQDSIKSVEVDSNNDVHVVFASGFIMLFPLSADGGDVYKRFMLALQSDAFAGHTIADFAYLDLRFGNRLYYKLKGK